MRKPGSMRGLEELGRVRLSRSFFFREFLYSEIANFHRIANIPEHPDLAIEVGRKLCTELLEPLVETFGRISIRSAYRSARVNKFGNENGLNCARNENDGHIWDERDTDGSKRATACIVVHWFLEQYEATKDWRPLAWWIHDHLPYDELMFFPKLAAFNIRWREQPRRRIYSHANPRGWLTKPGLANHAGRHDKFYAGFPPLKRPLNVAVPAR
jgi:hypothetical protein